MAKFCTQCGAKLDDDDLFCGVCGVSLVEQNADYLAEPTPKEAIYVKAPDKSSGKRKQHIHIKYDGIGFIPLDELMKHE